MLNIFWIQIFSHLYMLHIHTSSLRFVTWCVYGVTDTDGLILMRSQLLSVGQKKCWHACPRHQPAFYLMERELVKGFNNLIFFNVCLFLRETYGLWAGEGHRERETQNPKQAPGSELSTQSPTWDSNSGTMRSWPELKSDTQPTEPPRGFNNLICISISSLVFTLCRTHNHHRLFAPSIHRPY